MGLFENLPYTNFHRANLAWVLDTVKKLDKDFQDLDDYVKNYFENLDLSDDIEEILDIWYDDGRMATLMGLDFIRTYNTMSDMQHDTELQEGMVGMTKGFSSALDGLAGNYLVRAAGVGVTLDNGLIAVPISEDGSINLGLFGASGDITQLLAYCLGRYNRIHIPAGTYAISDRLTHSGDLVLTADKDALIVATITPSGSDAVAIRIADAQTVDISGGLWRYTTFNPSPISKSLCHDYALIKAQRCVNVDIHDIACDMAVNGQMFAYDRCENVSGHDADISYGSASGFIVQNGAQTAKFWNITASDFNNPYVNSGTPERWCYPISAGVYDLGAQIPMIESMTIENCTAKDCGWEAFDSHNSIDFTIRNCSAYNCYRFFGAYQEKNIGAPTAGGNLLVENCNFVNDSSYTMGQWFAGGNTGSEEGYGYENITWRNCVFRGKPSSVSGYNFANVVIDNCILDFGYSGGTRLQFFDCNVVFRDTTFANSHYSNGSVYVNRSIAEIRNCRYVADDGYPVISAVNHHRLSAIRYDRKGTIFYENGGVKSYRGLVYLPVTGTYGHFVDGGSLAYDTSGSLKIVGQYDNTADGYGSFGAGLFDAGATRQSFTMDVEAGSDTITIPATTYEGSPNPLLPGMVIDVVENGVDVRNVCITKYVDFDPDNGSSIVFKFAVPFTVTDTVTVKPVKAIVTTI